MRWLFLLHRYLGISVGALMVMWCGSGVVMMYHSYPALDANQRLENLAPLNWRGCCKIPDALLADSTSAENARVEMLAGRLVLSLGGASPVRLIDLATGSEIDHLSAEQAAAVARRFVKEIPAPPLQSALIDYDQWTVTGGFDADRPLYRFALGDDGGTELYVSSSSGRAVQITTQRERFWNRLGSVPHWLYFTELRRKTLVWSQLVIYASLLGCFLAGIGIYIGVRQTTAQPAGQWSPYRGFNLWHHIAGLAFGILTLSWVLSGLLSMNPWGLFEGTSAQTERTRLRGAQPSGLDLERAMQAFAIDPPKEIVSLTASPLNGRLFFIATTVQGERRRFNAAAAPAPLDDADLSYVAAALSGTGPSAVPMLLQQEDSYYFSHHRDAAPLPVYRIALRDGSDTRYYIDPLSGMLIAKVDRAAQDYRWWHQALHRLDFTAGMRGRPQWDALMLLLLSGVTLLCVTGAVLGCRRLLRTQRG
jgi:hypothetical protein